ncbi:deoxynucleotide monophosphate kinase family protein [Streptomyces scopuliridis]
MGNVGVIGRARTGKDTAGQWLVDNRGYRRIGFADPLKEAALKLNPIIDVVDYGDTLESLAEIVERFGWEQAKDRNPEIRRILQELGASIRAIDPEFWLRTALAKVTAANEDGVPVVITDVRYPNEAESLKRAGFHLVYIDRPGVPHLDHESEGALTSDDAAFHVMNSATVDDLYAEIELVMSTIHMSESRRHYARSL